jgi:two-component system LytT family sensor kinase
VFRSAITPTGERRTPPWSSALRRLRLVTLGWLTYVIAQWILGSISMRRLETEPYELLFALSLAVCWIGLTLAIWEWVGHVDRHRRSIPTWMGAHLLGYLVAGVVDAAWRRWTNVALGMHPKIPFHATWLYFSDLTAVAYVAVVVVKRVVDAQQAIVKQERRQLTLRTQVARAQLDYLQTQLQPHFLFNSLGAVMELAHEAPAASARMLRQLAMLLRFAVHGRGQTVTLGEELDALEPYLDIQRLRFADWLSIEHDVTADALRVPVPRLTLQPLVENAIRHGLAGRNARGRISIRASVDGPRLRLAVCDNGVGFNPAFAVAPSGIGLSNLRSRLATLYGDAYSLTLRTATGGGAVTEVFLPSEPSLPMDDDGLTFTGDHQVPVVQLPDLFGRNAFVTIVVGWLVWGVLWTQLTVAFLLVRDRLKSESIPHLLAGQVVAVALWAAITPLILRIARRFPLTGPGTWWRIALHVSFACGFALLHLGLWQAISANGLPLWSESYVPTMLWTVLLYAVFAGVTSYRQLSEWLRERETATARLRAELAEARLSAAAMRFDPDAVLASLEQVAETVLVDQPEAERELTQLADRLRQSLDNARDLPRTLSTSPAVRSA